MSQIIRSVVGVLLCSLITNPLWAENIAVNLRDGTTAQFMTGGVPTRDDVNEIVEITTKAGNPAVFNKIDFDPMKCPWEGIYLPCRPYSVADYDACLFNKMKGVNQNLTNLQFFQIMKMASRVCYREAGGTSH